MRSWRSGLKFAHGSPDTMLSAVPMPFDCTMVESSVAHPSRISTFGNRARRCCTNAEFRSTAQNLPSSGIRARISEVKEPVPGPISITRRADATPAKETMRFASAGDEGKNAPVPFGERSISKKNSDSPRAWSPRLRLGRVSLINLTRIFHCYRVVKHPFAKRNGQEKSRAGAFPCLSCGRDYERVRCGDALRWHEMPSAGRDDRICCGAERVSCGSFKPRTHRL